MPIELVSIPTDGEALDGLYYTPDHGKPIAAVMILHGNCHNFYTGPSRFLPPILTKRGFACLAFNRRGHDMVVSLRGRAIGGGSKKSAAEGIADDRCAADWLRDQGFPELICIGHSNGGMLAIKHCAENTDVRALVIMSAHIGGRSISPRISAGGLFAKDRMDAITAEAQAMVAQGRGRDLMLLPDWWWVISAESFIDRSLDTARRTFSRRRRRSDAPHYSCVATKNPSRPTRPRNMRNVPAAPVKFASCRIAIISIPGTRTPSAKA